MDSWAGESSGVAVTTLQLSGPELGDHGDQDSQLEVHSEEASTGDQMLYYLFMNKACTPFAAAQGIAFAFGRTSNTDECGMGENTGRRSESEMLHEAATLACIEKCVRRGSTGIFDRLVFECNTWLKTQHPYRKRRNSSACVGFRGIGQSVDVEQSLPETTAWRENV